MNKLPYFSIIVPCYNQAQYLKEAVESVIAQTFTNWECIIINDGSPDDTEKIATFLSQNDNRIKYFYKENGGVADARNYGIGKASGEWILPLDGDDKISDKYLERAYNVIKTNPRIKVIYSNAEFFGEKQGVWNLSPYDYGKLLIYNIIYCSAFYRKIDWLEIGGYDVNLKYGYEDWEFWINMLKDKKSVVYMLNSINFYYRTKTKSRNQNLLKDKEKEDITQRYIFEKHEDIYYEYFHSFQEILLDRYKKSDYIDKLNSKLHKNILTKFLFKIILGINKVI